MRSVAITLGFSVLLAAAPLAPAFSQTVQYDCSFDSYGSGGWIPEVLVLTIDEATGKGTAFDWLIQEFTGKPAVAKLIRKSDDTATFGWTVRTVDERGQKSRMEYIPVYSPDKGKTKLSARPAGYDSIFTGRGDCTVSES